MIHPRFIQRVVHASIAVRTSTSNPLSELLTWDFSVLRLVEETVPSLSQLLFVDLRLVWRFFLGWIVIEDLLRLLLGRDHTFNLLQNILIDVCHGSVLVFLGYVLRAAVVSLRLLNERLSFLFAHDSRDACARLSEPSQSFQL